MKTSEYDVAVTRLKTLKEIKLVCKMKEDNQRLATIFEEAVKTASLAIKLHGKKIVAKAKQNYDLAKIKLDDLQEDGWLLEDLPTVGQVLRAMKPMLAENSKSSRTYECLHQAQGFF